MQSKKTLFSMIGLSLFLMFSAASADEDLPERHLVSMDFLKSKLSSTQSVLAVVLVEIERFRTEMNCYEMEYEYSQSPSDSDRLSDAESLSIGIGCGFHDQDGSEGESGLTLIFRRNSDDGFVLADKVYAG